MPFSKELIDLKNKALKNCEPYFKILEENSEYNTLKVLDAMREVKVSDIHFNTSSGYAYSDIGRDKIEELYKTVFKGEKALVRTQFVSGTHALSTVLFGILRPDDEFVYVTGSPYDTMETVIGYKKEVKGSLKEFGIKYKEVPLKEDGTIDYEKIKTTVTKKTKMIVIQRSCGYTKRPSLTIAEIGKICSLIKSIDENIICYVDNCYGEFVDKQEPLEVGADIMAGSLIKNPGGGLCITGGYIVGKKELVDLASYRMTVPGMGAELGSSLVNNRMLFQGLFLAPHIVNQAIKAAIFAAELFTLMGYNTLPKASTRRQDIIQVVELKTSEKLIAFCQGIQKYSPVDSFVMPEPWDMPGYDDKVIMAAGTFVQGASIELSADGPLREPYNVFFQGGLTFEHAVIAIMGAAQNILDLDNKD